MHIRADDGFRESLLCSGGVLAAWFLVFPPPAYAMEVGCFCTFIFISSILMLSMGVTLVAKNFIAKRFWKLSWKRITFTTVLELIVLFAVLFLVQRVFYIRLLVYLPLAFLLNFALVSSAEAVQQGLQTPRKRLTMAAFSSFVLPIMILIAGTLTVYLSTYITFKEMRV